MALSSVPMGHPRATIAIPLPARTFGGHHGTTSATTAAAAAATIAAITSTAHHSSYPSLPHPTPSHTRYLSDAILADVQLQDDDEHAGGRGGGGEEDGAFSGLAGGGADGGRSSDGAARSNEPVFWPRQVYSPDDLRSANITIAALCFEESCESGQCSVLGARGIFMYTAVGC